MAGKRRRARILALKALFELDTVAHPPEQTLARLAEEMAVLDEALKFATELTQGVLQNRQSIDNLITPRRYLVAVVFERVRKIIADQLGVEEGEIKPETSFVDDLNADSLDLVELIM